MAGKRGYFLSITLCNLNNVGSMRMQPGSAEELAELLKQNAAGEKRAIVPVGGGTWLDFGNPVSPGLELHTNQIAQVLDYPARDMTITAHAGLAVGKLLEILREERQQIPVDFSQDEQATLGGVIAANVSGPRRFGLGTLRDYLIGLTAVDASGRTFHAGGRVVKNVAGYDLCKLMVGSWGTLAVLTEVTLKVLPIPETQAWMWSSWDSATKLDAALAALLTSETRPLAVEVLNAKTAALYHPDRPAAAFVLAVLVAGSAVDTDWQTQKLTQELAPHKPVSCDVLPDDRAGNLLETLTEFPVSTNPLTIRAHLLPSRTMEFVDRVTKAGFSVQAHAGNGIVVAHAPNELETVELAQGQIVPLREFAESSRGSLVILNCPAEWKPRLSVFGTGHSSWDLMQNLKRSLDPLNLLSPNRLFASKG
jgi:glycolate oxidase FAD binding subunit